MQVSLRSQTIQNNKQTNQLLLHLILPLVIISFYFLYLSKACILNLFSAGGVLLITLDFSLQSQQSEILYFKITG